ncbi:MAG: CD225/dispanin family protein [Bacteroidales bacterium]|nr:CD225/dispanin family protein [Bacteroidales bacterium]
MSDFNSVLPPHSNKMFMSVVCTLFCCVLTGIIAIVMSAQSNSLYREALCAQDNSLRQSLYYESESRNRTAKIMNIISIIVGTGLWGTLVALSSMGILASLMQ